MQGIKSHSHWSSRLTFLFAAIGSSVGLGNIWKFPYVAGVSGGGAFVLIYLGCVLFIVLPLLLCELVIGRRGQQSAINSMLIVAREGGHADAWRIVGWMGVVASFLILTFYSVIAGWSLDFLVMTASGKLSGASKADVSGIFGELMSDPTRMIMWHAVFMALTVFIVARGVHQGLEKAVTIIMPSLFAILLVLLVYVMFVGDFMAGVRFLFEPDFSKINANIVLTAVGQAFFSVGVGIGVMITYGAYLTGNVSIPRMGLIIVGADTLVALIAGLIIFPLVFTYGLTPGQGPGLIYATLPNAFAQMPGGAFFGSLFFLLLAFAALTSSISMLEPMISWAEEHRNANRAQYTIIAGLVAFVLGIGTVLSFNAWADVAPLGMFKMFEGKTIFDLLDYLTSNVLLPLGGLLIAVFVGWKMSDESTAAELGLGHGALYDLWRFLVRFVAPVALAVVFVSLI